VLLILHHLILGHQHKLFIPASSVAEKKVGTVQEPLFLHLLMTPFATGLPTQTEKNPLKTTDFSQKIT
jgi:hypothetical protein